MTREPSRQILAGGAVLTQAVHTVLYGRLAARARVPVLTHTSVSVCQLFTVESALGFAGI